MIWYLYPACWIRLQSSIFFQLLLFNFVCEKHFLFASPEGNYPLPIDRNRSISHFCCIIVILYKPIIARVFESTFLHKMRRKMCEIINDLAISAPYHGIGFKSASTERRSSRTFFATIFFQKYGRKQKQLDSKRCIDFIRPFRMESRHLWSKPIYHLSCVCWQLSSAQETLNIRYGPATFTLFDSNQSSFIN